jgi:hypothetical protein
VFGRNREQAPGRGVLVRYEPGEEPRIIRPSQPSDTRESESQSLREKLRNVRTDLITEGDAWGLSDADIIDRFLDTISEHIATDAKVREALFAAYESERKKAHAFVRETGERPDPSLLIDAQQKAIAQALEEQG